MELTCNQDMRLREIIITLETIYSGVYRNIERRDNLIIINWKHKLRMNILPPVLFYFRTIKSHHFYLKDINPIHNWITNPFPLNIHCGNDYQIMFKMFHYLILQQATSIRCQTSGFGFAIPEGIPVPDVFIMYERLEDYHGVTVFEHNNNHVVHMKFHNYDHNKIIEIYSLLWKLSPSFLKVCEIIIKELHYFPLVLSKLILRFVM